MWSYRRWRHTRGFGVHSPFAYRMVTDVIRPGKGYAFYGYTALKKACAKDRIEAAPMLFLLRLIAFLRPKSVFFGGSFPKAGRLAARLADSRIRILKSLNAADRCDLIVASADELTEEEICRRLSQAGCAILLSNAPLGWKDKIFDSLPGGLMLYDDHRLFALNRPEMMKVEYSILLP